MVVDQVEIEGVTVLKSEDEAPIAADRQAPAAFEFAFELVEPVAGKAPQVVERLRGIELGQHPLEALDLIGANAAGVVVLEQPSEAFMAKALDGYLEQQV